jgi:hypothetical protein
MHEDDAIDGGKYECGSTWSTYTLWYKIGLLLSV